MNTLHPIPVSVVPEPPLAPQPEPRVQVHLFAAAAAELGADELTVHGATLGAVLGALVDGAGETARQVVSRCSLLVNGVATGDLERPLVEGDRVDVLPPFAGG